MNRVFQVGLEMLLGLYQRLWLGVDIGLWYHSSSFCNQMNNSLMPTRINERELILLEVLR
jgi:hypothetical protein